MTVVRIPLNFFGMGFGLAGLATTWRIAGNADLTPSALANVLVTIATMVWLISCILYLRYAAMTRGALGAHIPSTASGAVDKPSRDVSDPDRGIPPR